MNKALRSKQLLDAWKKLQLSYYGGKYSIHRLLALETYAQSTSLVHGLLVCIWTPLPMAALVFLFESLPLCDPKDGWQANYGFWIRVAIVVFVIAQTSTGEAVYFIDNFNISSRQLTSLSGGIAVIFTACAMAISAGTIFPIPFLILVLTPVYNIIHIILFRVILGAQMLRQLFAQRKQLIQYTNFLHAQIMMMFVYPIYEVLFRFVEGSNFQLPVILLLPSGSVHRDLILEVESVMLGTISNTC
ncbi:hypothetical protein PHYSODRAFT_510952 [Phytophthora sojae]|uniref:Uncharacterized protein n=1 Tax=Phytophthora sojae (strain P6497) TaxID=1094619 RepID=G4ZVA3_PHYSP|nr:hypothetical protein PHYSODRAFT_510952 [Phytophthora sojae]EGZ13727.1 hypothetical protein PHYSODRAFT_510952 [Phytophthora sojae]|eukprot:XP_009531156.1 hypothetical protein PHYSODRAFT_510952 [Phytophthora sojae]